MIRSKLTAPALLVALLAAGCEDPASKVTPAKVEPARPVDATAGLPSEIPPRPAAAATSPVAKLGDFVIAPETSKIEFVGSKTLPVPGKHDGGFKSFSGVVEMVPGKPEVAKVDVVIDATSIFSDDPKLTGHLKNKDFFEVDTYPTARFVTTEIKATGGEKGATHTLVGNLTLHGVTKSIEVPATVKVEGDAATIRSEFSLKRTDFGITYGAPAVRELVVIKLDVKAVKKG